MTGGALPFIVRRNLALYFRDRMAVFYSMLGALVVLALYAFFIRDAYVTGLEAPGAANATDLWMIGSLMAIVPVTTSLGALGAFVSDREHKRANDFAVSPVSPLAITGGYLLSTMLIATAMSLGVLALSQAFMLAVGGTTMGGIQFAKVLGVLAISVLSSTSILFLVVTFLRKESAFGGISTAVGVFSGFVVGAYIPLGDMPGGVSSAFSVLPMSSSASLFREILAADAAASMYAGAPPSELIDHRAYVGFDLYVGDFMLEPWMCAAVILASAVAAFLLAVLNLRRGLA
ncbi:MAG: ABC transporter permease [Thermoplasmatales archaeon]|nr:ABC transporter permease [Thermoplasmatales archaeon]